MQTQASGDNFSKWYSCTLELQLQISKWYTQHLKCKHKFHCGIYSALERQTHASFYGISMYVCTHDVPITLSYVSTWYT